MAQIGSCNNQGMWNTISKHTRHNTSKQTTAGITVRYAVCIDSPIGNNKLEKRIPVNLNISCDFKDVWLKVVVNNKHPF